MLQAGQSFGTYSEPSITVNRVAGNIIIDTVGTVPMSITRLAGYKQATMPVNVATSYDQHDIELGLALDVTGSMRGTKLSDLKLAAKDLVEILMPDSGQSNRVRIGLAPYAASINAGSYAETVTDTAAVTTACMSARAPSGSPMLRQSASTSSNAGTV